MSDGILFDLESGTKCLTVELEPVIVFYVYPIVCFLQRHLSSVEKKNLQPPSVAIFIIEFNTGNFFQTTVYLKSHGNCFFYSCLKTMNSFFFSHPVLKL